MREKIREKTKNWCIWLGGGGGENGGAWQFSLSEPTKI